MNILLVGFDSAWTPGNKGALIGAILGADGVMQELGAPVAADFPEAAALIRSWQRLHAPSRTLILLDQPTVVPNASGQRPVENIVASPVSLRYGGVQPANTSRHDMFGATAPVWSFLAEFGGEADPFTTLSGAHVLETFPVPAMIALGWILPDARRTGRLPKYNPERKKTFKLEDWMHVCGAAAGQLRIHGLQEAARWLENAALERAPRKALQDGVDSCICLLVAAHLANGKHALLVGNTETGYMVLPHGDDLVRELNARCVATGRRPQDWVRPLRLSFS
jgi:predicted RNase H-like nuclease